MIEAAHNHDHDHAHAVARALINKMSPEEKTTALYLLTLSADHQRWYCDFITRDQQRVHCYPESEVMAFIEACDGIHLLREAVTLQ